VDPAAQPAPDAAGSDRAAPSLSSYIQELRARSAHAVPRGSGTDTPERRDPALAQALAEVQVFPTLENNRRAAEAYFAAGILDQAYRYFEQAAKIDPKDPGAADGIARIWRDWKFPHLALPHAHRAVSWAPASPVPHNTLGTILWALGRGKEARAEFERALELDATAAYALNNLCYSWLMEADTDAAAGACRAALAVAPEFTAARNNLALAHAQVDDTSGAEAQFAAAGSPAAAQYNIGIVHLARRRFQAAAAAFDRAAALQPGFAMAEVRALRARRLAHEAGQHGEGDDRR
jgi:superkiller protein 3